MLTVKKSIDIDAPVEKVYEFVYGIVDLPEVWAGLEEVTNLKTEADGRRTYDWTYKMAGVRLKGHSVTEVAEECRRTVTHSMGGIQAEITWTFEPLSANATRVTSQTDYTIPIPVVGRLAEGIIHGMNERESETTLANLKLRLES